MKDATRVKSKENPSNSPSFFCCLKPYGLILENLKLTWKQVFLALKMSKKKKEENERKGE